MIVASCATKEAPARSERPAPTVSQDPQDLLDSATKRMNDAGTGSYTTEVAGMGATIKGEFDLNKPFISQSLTMRTPDFPDGFTVRSLSFKKEAFARVSAGPASECWMHYDLADMAASQGVTQLESLSPSDLLYSAPPAAEILKDPIARGFTAEKNSINADVSLQAAFSAALPKGAFSLAKELEDEELLAPVVLTVDDGAYTEASYAVGDLLVSGEINAADLRKAGMSGDGMTPKQAFDLLSSLTVQIKYGKFGQKVAIVRPKKDEIAEIDLATMDAAETITCNASIH